MRSGLFKGIKGIIKAFVFAMVFVVCAVVSMKAECNRVFAEVTLPIAETKEIRVLVISIDPKMKNPTECYGDGVFFNRQYISATEYFRFNLESNVNVLKEVIEESSAGVIKINIVDTVVLQEFPKYTNGDVLTEEEFFRIFPYDSVGKGEWDNWNKINSEQHILSPELDHPGQFDYQYLLDKLNLVERKNNDEFDAVWCYCVDPSGMYETAAIGRTPLCANGDWIEADCDSFILGGFTFARKNEATESFAHTCEAVLNYVYGVSQERFNTSLKFNDLSELSTWEKFFYCKHLGSEGNEVYGVGNVHFAPNSEEDYDWANSTPVQSYYLEFANNYPNITGKATTFLPFVYMYRGEDLLEHHRWWMSLFPHYAGRDENGYLHNWWEYIFATEYTDFLQPAEEYRFSVITLHEGEELNDIPFIIGINHFRQRETTVKQSGAIVKFKANGSVGYKNGVLKAYAKGENKFTILYDGKKLEYTISVLAEDEEEVTNNDYTSEENNSEETIVEEHNEEPVSEPQQYYEEKAPDCVALLPDFKYLGKTIYMNVGDELADIPFEIYYSDKSRKSVSIKSEKVQVDFKPNFCVAYEDGIYKARVEGGNKLTIIYEGHELTYNIRVTEYNRHNVVTAEYEPMEPVQYRILVAVADPTISNPGFGVNGTKFKNKKSIKLSEYLNCDVSGAVAAMKKAIEEATDGLVTIKIEDILTVDCYTQYRKKQISEDDYKKIYPMTADGTGRIEDYGKRFDESFGDSTFWILGNGDWNYVIDTFDLVNRKNNDEFDAVWYFGAEPLEMDNAIVGKSFGFYWYDHLFERECESFCITAVPFSNVFDEPINALARNYNRKFAMVENYPDTVYWTDYYYNPSDFWYWGADALEIMPKYKGRDINGFLRNWWEYAFATDKAAALVEDAEFPGKVIKMTTGERLSDIPFIITKKWYETEGVNTSIKTSGAVFYLTDESIVSYTDEEFVAEKPGEVKLHIAMDGLELVYKFKVADKEEIAPIVEVDKVADDVSDKVIENTADDTVVDGDAESSSVVQLASVNDMSNETVGVSEPGEALQSDVTADDNKNYNILFFVLPGVVLLALAGGIIWYKLDKK